MAEQNTEQSIRVRDVTELQASWTEHGRGDQGSFTYQLILDNGAEEYVLQPNAEDAKVILELLQNSQAIFFDLDNKVLIPNNIPLG